MTTKLTINNPSLSSNVSSLRYIGPFISQRLRDENIRTLSDLKDTFSSQSRTQNIKLLKKITENLRPQECVGKPKYIKDPPGNLKPGYYTYCIRNYNRGAWYAIVTYLKRKKVSESKLPSNDPPRGVKEICSNKKGCISNKAIPKKFESSPKDELEGATKVLLNSRVPLTAIEIFRESKLPGNARTMVAVLRGNAGTKGKKLFKSVAPLDGSTISRWDLKSTVKSKIKNLDEKNLINYIRKEA